MKPAIQFFRRLLPARDPSMPIEQRLFEITLFLTLITLLLWSVVGLVAGYILAVQALYIFALFFYSGIYYAVKKRKSFSRTTVVYYTTALLMISAGWLPSGGIRGAIMHMCVLVYISGLLVLPLRRYVVFIIATICVVVTFAAVEFFFPSLAVPYGDFTSMWRDLYIAGIVMLVMMGTAFYVFKKEYIQDRNDLKKTIGELAESKEKAVAADRAKSQFLATISHEMRTPLNGIVGLSELIGQTKLTAEQSDLVKNLKVSTHALSSIISDVLDLSMIENNKIMLEETVFELKKAVADVVEVLQTEVQKKKGLELRHRYQPEGSLFVKGDLKRIRQVLLNLLTNAVKFTDKGRVTLTTTIARQEKGKVWILFAIEDTGPGIPKRQQREVFTRFFKASGTGDREGTGLGLSISKSLAQLMGGRLWFTSVESVGSVFHFEIPLITATPAPDAPAVKNGDFSKLKVLVAEDVRINRVVVAKMLKNLGINNVELVEDGLSAVEKALSADFDFILMDLQMPNMDGIAAAKEIIGAFEKRNKQPPVIIALTANAMKEDELACQQAGMKGFVTKPFKSDTLAGVFNQHMRHS